MELTCEQLEELLPEVMDGKLDAAAEAGAAVHLATCDRCRVIVDETTQVRTVAREHGKLTLPDEARDRILGFLKEEPDGKLS